MIVSLSALLLVLAIQPPEPEVGVGPRPAPHSIAWELRFEFVEPRRIESGGQVYWYMVYTATNTSDRTQKFFPIFQLVTENLEVLDTDQGIPMAVFESIRDRHKLTHPYLQHPVAAIGNLRIGDDHAIESVAIWRATDVKVNNFTIYVAGLSGETALVRNPAYDPRKTETQPAEPAAPEAPKVNPSFITLPGEAPPSAAGTVARTPPPAVNSRYFVLRKTLELRYTLPGSADARGAAEAERIGTRWVMR